MTDVDEHGRPEPPPAADEAASIMGFLDYQRATFEWKTRGLDAAGLRATVGVSTMTLGGMIKHLALVEDSWFSHRLHGRDYQPRWAAWTGTPTPTGSGTPRSTTRPRSSARPGEDAVTRSRESVTEALATGGLDQLARRAWPDGRAPSLRWILAAHDRGVRAAQRPRGPHP